MKTKPNNAVVLSLSNPRVHLGAKVRVVPPEAVDDLVVPSQVVVTDVDAEAVRRVVLPVEKVVAKSDEVPVVGAPVGVVVDGVSDVVVARVVDVVDMADVVSEVGVVSDVVNRVSSPVSVPPAC